MNKYLSLIIMIALTILVGIWLDNTLPHYGYALGTGMGLSFCLGVLIKI